MSPIDPTSDVSPSTGSRPGVRVRVDLPGSVTLTVSGDLDDAGAAVLDRELVAAADADHRQVTVDLCGATSLGAAAVRALGEMHGRSRSRGRALRILVDGADSSRLLAEEGLGAATQVRPRAPAVPERPPAVRPPPGATAVDARPPGRHLSLVRTATAPEQPVDHAAAGEQGPPSSGAAVELLHWAASWSTCADMPAVVSAVADKAWQSLAEVELAEVEVLDPPEGPGWSGAAGRGRAPHAVVGRSRADAVAALTAGSGGTVLTLRLGGAGAPVVGSLIVSSGASSAFRRETWEVAHLIAALVTGVLAGARHRHHMARALGDRELLGRATGMLMERRGLSPDRALAELTHASSVRGVPIGEVAESLLRTGGL
jgi:hypothetical protein